jgi:hypothetical protein
MITNTPPDHWKQGPMFLDSDLQQLHHGGSRRLALGARNPGMQAARQPPPDDLRQVSH